MRKAQGGVNAAILIAVIAGLIILYILFLPDDERRKLIENENGDKSNGNDDEIELLLEEFPGRIDIVRDIKDKTIPSVFLFETTNAKELERINSFIIRNGWFDDKSKTVSFNLEDLENTDNLILSFKATKHKGILTIELNNDVIYENEITSETVAPIMLSKGLILESNTFEFSVSSVGFKFWRTNEYNFDDIKIVGDITDKSSQESENIFILTGTEKNNIERADLRFVPYCGNVADVGVLEISINSRKIFSAIPVCEDAYRQPIPLGLLDAGSNNIIFKTNKGSYSIEQIKVEFDEKEIIEHVFFFEINQSTMDDVDDGDKEVTLTIVFVDDKRNKRADLNINNRLSSIDEEDRIFTKNIDDLIEVGNNFIEITPRTRLDIVEITVELD